MALKVEVENLDGIAESLHEHYTKGDDGTYRLDYEGAPDISGLKSALEKERRNVKGLKTDIAVFDGFKAEDLQELKDKQLDLDELERLRKDGGTSKEKIDEIVNTRVQAMVDEHETVNTKNSETIAGLRGRLSKLMVDDVVLKAAVKAGAVETATGDIIRRARDVFKVVDDELKPMKGDDVIYGKDGVSPLSVDDWITDLATNAGHLFKPSSGGGAANEGNGGGAGGVKTKADLATSADKAKYIGEHGQAAYLELPASAEK